MNTLCCGQCHSTFPPLESVCAPEVDIAIKSQTFWNKRKENNCEAPMTSRTKPSVVQSPVSANLLFSFVWKSVRKPASAGIGTLKLKGIIFFHIHTSSPHRNHLRKSFHMTYWRRCCRRGRTSGNYYGCGIVGTRSGGSGTVGSCCGSCGSGGGAANTKRGLSF